MRAMTADIIMAYAFGISQGCLGSAGEGCQHPLVLSLEDGIGALWTFKHIPEVKWVVYNIVPLLVDYLPKQKAGLGKVVCLLKRQVDAVLRDPKVLKEQAHRTIYDTLLETKESSPIPLTKIRRRRTSLLLGATPSGIR
jgi:hypothetical protein